MKTNSLYKKMALVFAVGLMALTLNAQNILTVDNNGGISPYQTLQQAIDASATGDIIHLKPSSVSYGDAIIDKGLSIIGRSHSQTGKISEVGDISLAASSDDVRIRGVKINQLNIVDVSGVGPTVFAVENVVVSDCFIKQVTIGTSTQWSPDPNDFIIPRFKDLFFQGNVVERFEVLLDVINVIISNTIISDDLVVFGGGVIVKNNIFRDRAPSFGSSGGPISIIIGENQSITLTNNMFITSRIGPRSINLSTANTIGNNIGTAPSSFILRNNLTYNFDDNGDIIFSTSAGNTIVYDNNLENIDPMFTNAELFSITSPFSSGLIGGYPYNPALVQDEDYSLLPTSPALNGGENGSEIGLFGENFNYNTLGTPRGTPTLDVISADANAPADGNISITVSAKAN